jgi:hypothetical protein
LTTALRDEEAFDRRRIPDDRQAIAVTDQLNLVIHRPLLKRGQGEPGPQVPRRMGVGFVFCTVLFIARPSQCPSGRRGPGQFAEDGSPVADPSVRVRVVLPALQMVLKRMFIAEPTSGNDSRGRTAASDRGADPAYIDGEPELRQLQ